jgi:hypothetical protein
VGLVLPVGSDRDLDRLGGVDVDDLGDLADVGECPPDEVALDAVVVGLLEGVGPAGLGDEAVLVQEVPALLPEVGRDGGDEGGERP